MIYASVDATKDYLRYDGSDQDAIIRAALTDATNMVQNYLKSYDAFEVDSAGELEVDTDDVAQGVPGAVRRATMIMAGILLRDPAGTEMKDWQHGYLPTPVINLLYPLRDPALA